MCFFGVIDLGAFSFSLLPLEIIVGVILLALSAMWVFDKLIDMLGLRCAPDDSDDVEWTDEDEEGFRKFNSR